MYLGTQCTDAPVAAGASASSTATTGAWTGSYDYLTWANAWFNGPCAYWKYQAQHAGQRARLDRCTCPILMIGETFDAATPFSGSLVTRGCSRPPR